MISCCDCATEIKQFSKKKKKTSNQLSKLLAGRRCFLHDLLKKIKLQRTSSQIKPICRGYTRAEFTILQNGTAPGTARLDRRPLFFGLHQQYVWQETEVKFQKCQGPRAM